MPFPRRFQALHELTLRDVPIPDDVWLVYAVCAVDRDSCGWGGWMIEAAFRSTAGVSACAQQVCPRCAKPTFRTATRVQYAIAPDQSRARSADSPNPADFEIAPIDYED